MGYEDSTDTSKRWVGLIPAILFHVVLVYGLTSGLGKEIVKKVQQSVVMAVPVAAPPPPPPPPPEISQDQPDSKPKTQAKRPAAFVPKAEVEARDAPPQAGITSVSETGDTQKVEADTPVAPTPAPAPAPKKEPVLEKARLMPGCKAPRYPAKSLEKEEEGLVVFRFLVGLDGSVKQGVLVQSSGFERLDKAAKEAFEKCKFTPGKIDGVSRETWVRQPFRWKIQ
jgi:protein TonB